MLIDVSCFTIAPALGEQKTAGCQHQQIKHICIKFLAPNRRKVNLSRHTNGQTNQLLQLRQRAIHGGFRGQKVFVHLNSLSGLVLILNFDQALNHQKR